MEEEVLFDMSWQSMEHIIDVERFDIPVLRAMSEDNFSLDFICINQIVAVVPKLIVVTSFPFQILSLLVKVGLVSLIVTKIFAS